MTPCILPEGAYRVFLFKPIYQESALRVQAEQHRLLAFGGMLSKLKLWDRVQEAEVRFVRSAMWYEPFWHASATRDYGYDKKRHYELLIPNRETQQVEIAGVSHPVDQSASKHRITIDALDHARGQRSTTQFCAASPSRKEIKFEHYLKQFGQHLTESDLPHPQMRAPNPGAAAVVQRLASALDQPIDADLVYDDRISITQLHLYFHPILGFEFLRQDKGKSGVVLADGLSGELSQGEFGLSEDVTWVGGDAPWLDVGRELATLGSSKRGLVLRHEANPAPDALP